ncbi:MAG TPA: DUF1489 domain-containing protein [Caulobacteraceae bacterium]|nr:DUF1489 domain-containing protein [Caulobacteraceae bacterium]
MALHLIKLAVGASDVGDLIAWSKRRGVIGTRMTPKRGEEILDGGSLYWVVKGTVLVRMPVTKLETTGEKGRTRCMIHLSPAVLTAAQPRRAFQGWRYLRPEDAPPDLADSGAADLPTDLAKQLRELGAW